MFLGIAVTDGPAQTLSEPPGGAGLPSLVTGVVTSVYVDDFARGSAELVQTIRDARTGRSFRLRFERAPAPSLQSGAVRLHGVDLVVPVPVAGEGDGVSLGRPGGEVVIMWPLGQNRYAPGRNVEDPKPFAAGTGGPINDRRTVR